MLADKLYCLSNALNRQFSIRNVLHISHTKITSNRLTFDTCWKNSPFDQTRKIAKFPAAMWWCL